MKIVNKLRMLAIVPSALAIVVALTVFFSARWFDNAQRQERAAVTAVTDAFELDGLAHRFVYQSEFGPERPRQQWISVHKDLAGQLSNMNASNDEDQQFLDQMREDHKQIDEHFRRLIANREQLQASSEEMTQFLEAQKQNLVRKLLDDSLSFREAASDLAQSSHQAAQKTQQQANLLVLILVGSTVPVVVVMSVLITRSITNPIARLHDGVEAIEHGDLNHRAGTNANDEIGELSRAFDQMASELQVLIEQHRWDEAEMQSLNETLEQRVQQRTAQLARANEALEQSNVELQQFAYIASHDLQTPLRGIAGFAQLLETNYQGKFDEKADGYINLIVESAKRMQTLITDLLTYSRVESRVVPFKPTDLGKVVDEVVEILNASIKEAEGEVTCDELPTITGDRSQLSQLLQNLIGNGLKYHGDEPAHVHVSAEHSGRQWTIAVRDNGIGIEAKHHEKIFEIFRRLHSEEKYPGTGIGLAICRRIVHRHSGRIWLESEPGKGSTFYFMMPTRAPEER